MQQFVVDPSRMLRVKESHDDAAHILLQMFARYGVRAAFGIPGGLISPVFRALADVPQIELVCPRHESMGVFCAMGHYIATGVPALVLTTSGPGATNIVTGLAAALSEEIPVIAVAGEVATGSTSRAAFQDATTSAIDVVAMMRTISRWSMRVESAAGAAGAAENAFRAAVGPRPGPVFLSLPVDVAASHTQRTNFACTPASLTTSVNIEACRKIARSLARAQRPLFIVGNGARGAAGELLRVARKLAVPVITTAHAKGIFPESDPLSLGVIGWGGHASAAAYLASGPDVVCVVGSRLGEIATNGWTMPIAGSDSTFQIDRNPQFIGRNYPVTMAVIADAKPALVAIAEAMSFDVVRPEAPAKPALQVAPINHHAGARVVHPKDLFARLQLAFPDASWAVDIGEHGVLATHYLKIDHPNRFRTMLGLGSMGSGIGVAIGWKQADRSRQVICVCGDGGFMMHAGEILSCVEHGIGVIFVVANDGRWNMVNRGFDSVYGFAPPSLPSRIADIAGVASNLGAVGVLVESKKDLERFKLEALATLGRPVVLDVRIDPEIAMSDQSRARALTDAAFGGGR